MGAMTVIDRETVDRINQLIRDADSFADRAITCAAQVGNLLIEVKSKVGHGNFTPWIEQNLNVTARQARRYMSTALGRSEKVLLEHKTDMMSDLKELPIFLPLPGFSYALLNEKSTAALASVEWSKRFPAFFFVIVFDGAEEGQSGYSYSPRPVEGIAVHGYLQHYGISDPKTCNWRFSKSDGVTYAGESLCLPSYCDVDKIIPQLSPRRLIGEEVLIQKDHKTWLNLDAEIDLDGPYDDLNLPKQIREIYADALLTSLAYPLTGSPSSGV
jgi:hypothetical protein